MAAAADGVLARRLIRRIGHAALATSFAGAPYASLVAVACDTGGDPLLLLSSLARHTQNIAADPRVSLLFADRGDCPDPLAAPRLSLVGRAEPETGETARARFVARHPAAARYAGFADFGLYRIVAERGHLVAGFGRIAWIDGGELRLGGDWGAFAAAATGILAAGLCAARLLHRPGGDGWRITGIDPDGIDLRDGDDAARLDFPAPMMDPAAAQAALHALIEAARAVPARSAHEGNR